MNRESDGVCGVRPASVDRPGSYSLPVSVSLPSVPLRLGDRDGSEWPAGRVGASAQARWLSAVCRSLHARRARRLLRSLLGESQ